MSQESTTPDLPPSLRQAISSNSGGRVVLVLGAGCSNEEPTDLPLSGDLAQECYRKLVAYGILKGNEVTDKRDLSAVADAVYDSTGSQRALVECFPPDVFRNARPNDGYQIMAALLLEGALSNTLTLNFDSAARAALALLGARDQVTTVRGPKDHARLGMKNVIYLHGDIDSDPDEIILRTAELEEAWRDSWGEVIAQRVLGGPVTVFVGLGSPASVLVDTARRILASLDGQASFYVVDPTAYEDSSFANALDTPSESYLQIGWSDFMRALAKRLVEEHGAEIERACYKLNLEQNNEEEDFSELCQRLIDIGLVGLGKLRAAWLPEGDPYLPYDSGIPLRLFTNLLLGVRVFEKLSNRRARFSADGLVEFYVERNVERVMVCSGLGSMAYAQLVARLYDRQKKLLVEGKPVSIALIGGVDFDVEIATPSDIIAEPEPDDLVTGATYLRIFHVAKLQATLRSSKR